MDDPTTKAGTRIRRWVEVLAAGVRGVVPAQPPAAEGLDALPLGRRARGRERNAVSERGPPAGEADGAGVDAAGRTGHDQAMRSDAS